MGNLSEHFSRHEFACHCGCGYADPAPELLAGLEEIRRLAGGVPVSITSGCRCEEHNRRVGGSRHSQHLKGHAADIRIAGLSVLEMYSLAERVKAFAQGGIGIYPEPHHHFLHLDVRGEMARWGSVGGVIVGADVAVKRAAELHRQRRIG